jgi:hypothetical protein
MEYVFYAIAAVAFFWASWALYVFSMGIYRAYLNRKLVGLNLVMAWPIVAVAFTIDVLANITIASLIFLDPPEELLVTNRLQRYMAGDTESWRYKIASYICDHILDIFDPNGNHC